MIQYKLIKEYPGSQKLGAINWFKNSDSSCSDIWLGCDLYSKNTEFWQKIEKQKYQVGKWYRNSVGLFHVTKVENDTVFAYGFCREKLSENESFPIKKYEEEDVLACEEEIGNALIYEAKRRGYKTGIEVKRTQFMLDRFDSPKASINVVIEEDNFNYDDFDNSLTIDGRVIFIQGKWAEIIEAKTPLFTTEDGVDIFKGDSYYLASNDFCICYCSFYSKPDLAYKLFSTKEKAEEYILLNKPCLSLNDVSKYYKALLSFSNGNSMGLRNLVKSKL
jgi:hypothetical protein